MSDAVRYIGRRFVQLVLVIWVAGTLNFVVPRLIPGDPIEAALAKMQADRSATHATSNKVRTFMSREDALAWLDEASAG